MGLKIIVFLLSLSIFFILREFLKFFDCFLSETKFKISNRDRVVFFIACAYVITIIITGVKI